MSRFDRIQNLMKTPLTTLGTGSRKLMDELRTRPRVEAARARLDALVERMPADVRAPLEEEVLTFDAVRRAAAAASEAIGAALRGAEAPVGPSEPPAPAAATFDEASVEAEMGSEVSDADAEAAVEAVAEAAVEAETEAAATESEEVAEKVAETEAEDAVEAEPAAVDPAPRKVRRRRKPAAEASEAPPPKKPRRRRKAPPAE